MTILSLTPTFTQGLILGQLSILLLLAFILKYLFFDATPEEVISSLSSPSHPLPASHPSQSRAPNGSDKPLVVEVDISTVPGAPESSEWFNFLLSNIVQAYRSNLRGGLPGSAGDEAARMRIERWAQDHLKLSFMAPVQIHAVDLGNSAPRLSNARMTKRDGAKASQIDLDLTYTDSITISLSTSLLFNYPTLSFARLPISLTLSLSLFSGVITLTPPTPTTPSFSLALQPNFALSLRQTSLMGSRAKLSDVPKVHQMIEDQIRSLIEKAGVYYVLLPGLGVHEFSAPGTQRKEVDILVEK